MFQFCCYQGQNDFCFEVVRKFVSAKTRINYVHDKGQNLQFCQLATQMKGKLTYQIMIQSHDA